MDHNQMDQQQGHDQAMGGMDVDQNQSQNLNAGIYQSPPSNEYRPTTSQSADFPSSSTIQHQPSPNVGYPQQQPGQGSRPPSDMSNNVQHTQIYQQQQQQPPQQQQEQSRAQSSVVIKVGMVGDAQIGKTSLMVKYVEGSWDEDYIQTLGW